MKAREIAAIAAELDRIGLPPLELEPAPWLLQADLRTQLAVAAVLTHPDTDYADVFFALLLGVMSRWPGEPNP